MKKSLLSILFACLFVHSQAQVTFQDAYNQFKQQAQEEEMLPVIIPNEDLRWTIFSIRKTKGWKRNTPSLSLYENKFVFLREESEQNTCCNGRADDTCHIGTQGVHEKVVVGVCLESFVLGDAGSHRNG